jgi:membrane-associated protease RseP (regulator of RpoE activity)
VCRFSNNEMGGPIAVVKAGAQMAEYSPTALIGEGEGGILVHSVCPVSVLSAFVFLLLIFLFSVPISIHPSSSNHPPILSYSLPLGFMASLSINLAVLNSLPFPSLDGGQLAFVIAEVVAGTYRTSS